MFGSKGVFVADDPIIKEWRRLFRVLYADGEMFAQGVTCVEFLEQRPSPKSENERAAQSKELAEGGSYAMPRTQAEIQRLLEGVAATGTRQAMQQLGFTL